MPALWPGHYERGERIGAWFWPLLWNRATYPARHVFFSANLASLDALATRYLSDSTLVRVLACAARDVPQAPVGG
jgi:hypothetical protein